MTTPVLSRVQLVIVVLALIHPCLTLAQSATTEAPPTAEASDTSPPVEAAPEPEQERPAQPAASPAAEEPTTTHQSPQELAGVPDGPALSLEQAQQIALERNPNIQSAALELERSSALIRQAWAAIYPNLGANLQYTMADQPTVASFDTGMSDVFGEPQEIVIRRQHVAALGLTARQPLFNGRSIPGIRTAYEMRDISELTVEQVNRQLILAIAQAFYSAISARRTLELLARTIELFQEDVEAARARLEVQAGLAIDVARAELQVERTRSQRETTLLGYENARDSLALLLGIDPSELPTLAEPARPPAADADEVDELVRQALVDRLDLRAARRQVRLAEIDRDSVWWAFAPSLDLTWSLSYTLTELGGFGDRRTTWNLILMLNVPLFDGGLRYGQLRDRRARLRQAQLNAEAIEQNISVQVRQAFRAWRTSMNTLEISRRQLELATETHRLARAAYSAGAATNIEVVDAQRALASAEVDVELQRLQVQLALIELLARLEVGPSAGASAGPR